jgi:hypothetical protein
MRRWAHRAGVIGFLDQARKSPPRVEPLESREHFSVAGLPTPDHIVIVIDENKAASSIIGSSSAPYINQLAAGGAVFSQSFAIEHPSQPNYLDLFSGSNQGVTSDSLPAGIPFTTSNLAANLRAVGISFAGYSENLPSTGLTADSTIAGGYRRKHNPWVNWQNDASPTANQLPSSMNRDFSAFPTDFTLLPGVSIVIPTQYHDMHDDDPNDGLNAIQAGDAWLKARLDAYAQWAKTHNSLLIVTFDEDDKTANNQISTVFYGGPVKPGTYGETINHYGVLRTLEDMYGAAYAGASATATPITDVWTTSTTLNVTNVATGSTWKYLDTGVSLDGVNWTATGYSTTGWKSGAAQLGYGDGDEKTVVSYGPDATKKYTTTYFRQSFNIVNKSVYQSMNLSLTRDDGAVVYLNGVEIARSNMPGGTVLSSTFASTVVGGSDESRWFNFGVDPALLVNGTNTIAVEIHQADLTSSDISFSLALGGVVTNAAPTVASLSDTPDPVGSGSKVTLTASTVADTDGAIANVKFYRESNGLAGLQTGGSNNDLLLSTDTSSSGGYTSTFSTAGLALGTYTYYARATDNFGVVSNVVTTTNTIHTNVAPKIGSLTASPNPVTAGTSIKLTANSVADSDGAISNVKFYRESNGVAGLQVGTASDDLLVGTDTSSSGGWTATVATTGLSGVYTFYARATDTAGATGNVVTTTVTINPTTGATLLATSPLDEPHKKKNHK